MALKKLQAFTAFLIAQNLVDENQIDSWMENSKIIPCSKIVGNGVRVCRLNYDAIFSIERFAGDENLLLALICVWLMDYDPSREDDDLPEPSIEIDVFDNKTSDVTISVEFFENIDLVKVDGGRIPFEGATWDVADVTVDEPDEAAVGDDQDKTEDKSYVHGG